MLAFHWLYIKILPLTHLSRRKKVVFLKKKSFTAQRGHWEEAKRSHWLFWQRGPALNLKHDCVLVDYSSPGRPGIVRQFISKKRRGGGVGQRVCGASPLSGELIRSLSLVRCVASLARPVVCRRHWGLYNRDASECSRTARRNNHPVHWIFSPLMKEVRISLRRNRNICINAAQ